MAPVEKETPLPRWRVGWKVPITVYEDDRPVCQCQTAIDAQRIVNAMNHWLQTYRSY